MKSLKRGRESPELRQPIGKLIAEHKGERFILD